MSWWNLAGLNPKYKDFVERNPEKTVIGMGWAQYWRIAVVGLVLELIFVGAILLIFFIISGHA